MNRYSRFPKVYTVVITIAVMIGLMGCSSDTNENTDETTSDSSNVTIDTKFGKVEVAEQPTRVVALGWGDAETALALGVEPIGASDWLDFGGEDRKSTRLNSSHVAISYAVFCLKKKNQ